MSWGEKFVEKLKILGYPQADKLSANDYDWFFDNEELAPFLGWFTDCVDSSNILTPHEISEYNKIEQSEIMLDGDALEQAINNLPQTEKEISIEDKLGELILNIKTELNNVQKQIEVKQKQSFKLNQHYTDLNEISNVYSSEIDKQNSNMKEKWTECMEAGKQFDVVLNDILRINQNLSSIYSGFFADSLDQNAFFLSQMDLEKFQMQEEKHNLLLKTYIKRQFFEGFEKVSNDTWNEISFQLKVGKPNLHLVQEETQNDYLYHCLALKRLCDFYPHIKLTEIDLQAEECQLIACIEKVKKMQQNIKSGKFPSDATSISRLQKEIHNQICPLRGRLDGLRHKTIVKLVNELADSQTVKTVTGDYVLKSIRQKYIISKLNKVLVYLVRQRARSEMLSLMYELELQNHCETSEVVQTVDKMIEEEHCNLAHTVVTLEQLTLASANFEVQSQDDACSTLYSLLVGSQHKSPNMLFLMINAAKALQAKLINVGTTSKEITKRQEQRENILEKLGQTLEIVTFSDSSVNKLLRTKFRPQTPITGLPRLEQAIQLLKRKVGELESKVFSNINDHNTKLKIIRNSESVQTERKLFHLFYTDPIQLEKISCDLELFTSRPTLLRTSSDDQTD